MKKDKSFLTRYTFFIISLVLSVYGLIQAREFLYPIAFGILLAYLLYPIVNYFEKKGIPRIIANLIAILFTIIVLGGTFTFFYFQLTNLLDEFAAVKKQAIENIEKLQSAIDSVIGIQDNTLESFLKDTVSSLFSVRNNILGDVFSATTGTIVKILLLPVYIFLFLYYRTKFAYFILKIVNKKYKLKTINILRDISTIAARYMGGVTIVVFILCFLNSLGLSIIGVRFAILFGIVSAFFNFIPYFGTLMGGAVPLLFVLVSTDEPMYYALRVIILFIIIQFTENNILTPNIVGGNVKLNPFFIIVGLILGAILWGIPGMLVVVPFLAIARIICYNIESLHPYAFLLGPRGTQRHSITMRKIRSFFYFKKKKE